MAYFRCVGGVGGGAVLTLTYSSEFYGETITATDGTKTVTKVAPSTGTMDITLPESGTWVVSATIDGQTYSTTVTVDIGYSATLFAIPDGSTVTPTDDIQTWLKCAGIRDKTTYTTLSDVLGDTETLIALCADSNACDYMARSTNWASGVAADSTAMLIVGKYNYCANALLGNSTWASAIVGSSYADYVVSALVPIMTSNTTPSGECFGSSSYSSGYPYYYAFDNSSSTSWASSVADAVGSYLGYDFGTDVHIGAIKIIGKGTKNNPTNITVQGYDTEWHDISTFDVNTSTIIYGISNTSTYTKCRVKVNSFDGTQGTNNVGVQTLQFYGRTDNANYIPLVPKMTSNTTPSGECSASAAYTSAYDAYKAFDGVYGDSNYWTSGSTSASWLQYVFDIPKVINRIGIRIWNDGANAYILKASNDNFATETTLSQGNFQNTSDAQYVDFENDTAYSQYRLYINSTYNNKWVAISVLQFYRKSDLPIIHSAVEDNIFYMDDGSPVALCGIPVGDTIDVDLEAYKGQTLTLVSTVAKDPDNLSNDFSMNVRITPNITEIYLMPIKSLYWWGYTITEATASSYRPSWTGASFTAPTIANNKNDIGITQGNSYGSTFFNTPEITDDSITVNLVAKQSGGGDNTYQLTSSYQNSYPYISNTNVNITQTSMTKYSQTYSGTSSRIIPVFQTNNSTLSIYALWFE